MRTEVAAAGLEVPSPGGQSGGEQASQESPSVMSSAVASSAAVAIPTERDLRLDLFRGIALWLIFLDHIPTNIVNWVTIRNYGFSDAAEIFIFISGYTAAFVYGRSMRERGLLISSA